MARAFTPPPTLDALRNYVDGAFVETDPVCHIAPFGGSGLSGIGREGGRWSLDFYSETTNICIKV